MQTQTRNAVKNEARAVLSPKTGHFQAGLLKTLGVVKKGETAQFKVTGYRRYSPAPGPGTGPGPL